MALFDFLKKKPIEQKSNVEHKEAPQVMMNITGGSYYRKDNYSSYADEGYRQNVIVYRCVNEVANGAASIPFKLYLDDVEIPAHPLLDLLRRPNPMQAGVEYFQALYSYLLLSGNSYAVRNEVDSIPREMHLLRPDRVRVVPSKTNVPLSYEYILNGKVINRYDADPMTGQSQVKHFKTFNPLDDYYGLSPIMASSVDIDNHNSIAKHNINLINNGARPSGAVIFKPSDDRGIPVQLTDGQRQQLQDDLNQRIMGTTNAGRPLLLEGDFDWKEMGLSPKDMDFLAQKNMSSKDIALAFGVPSQLIGVPDAQTYANVQEARLALYEETIIPLAMRVCSDLNEWLVPAFDENLKLEYDIDSIPAMTERRRRTYENVIQAVDKGIISRNEARSRLGLEPITGGDDVYIPANLFPLGQPVSEAANGEDAEKDAYEAYGIKQEIEKDIFTTAEEAAERSEEIGCNGYHEHETDNGTVYMPCQTHSQYERLTGDTLETPKQDPRFGEGPDTYDNVADAQARAKEIGCSGHHTIKGPDGNVYMPCESHAEWSKLTGNKDVDIDLIPTQEMADIAKQALEWRREFGRGGTEVGVARARQLTNRQPLSFDTVKRMYSFFKRHEVDKQAEGFRSGEDGFPSAGRIAWGLWGGDAGFAWSTRKRDQIMEAEEEKMLTEIFKNSDYADKQEVSGRTKKTLENKVKEHNEKYGDKPSKRVTLRMLSAVFRRGVGAYRTNPESVRRSVLGPDQWAIARVNAFLYAVRNNRFRRGKFDTDLLPKGHPLRTKE